MKAPSARQSVELRVGTVSLRGELSIPPHASGVVLFSQCGHRSSRDHFAPGELSKRGMATLALDLLTDDEDRRDDLESYLRFDVRLIADRLKEATEWVASYEALKGLSVGYFASDTAAAAAFLAAVEYPGRVSAIVVRGARPDLVHDARGRPRGDAPLRGARGSRAGHRARCRLVQDGMAPR